ncbi:MAG TPA: adenylate/guanylate cyclase domain-containing protein [Chloroflexia bacterium]|nr:adenylate/guanylate cyclase domain-containing protein [Chloroflexia bacterium]
MTDRTLTADRLLRAMLPAPIVERLLRDEPLPLADHFAGVTVLFADLVGFEALAAELAPAALVAWLDGVYEVFDRVAQQHGVEKIKTIGDMYMAVGGVPAPRPDHAAAVADLALALQGAVAALRGAGGAPLRLRSAIHSGPVVAGVIGRDKLCYDVWGATVNTASHLVAHSDPGEILVSPATHAQLRDQYTFALHAPVPVGRQGVLTPYLLTGHQHASAPMA